MPWDVDVSLVEDWIFGLDQESYEQLIAALELLEERGPMLGRPLVLFAFDPLRQAMLLMAGDKAGVWDRWYRVNIPLADDLLDRHLARLGEEGT